MVLPKSVIKIYLKKGEWKVLSNSMFPTIKKGDLVRVKFTKRFKFGDIIAYQSNEKIIIHRFFFSILNSYFTKGDHQRIFDEAWPKKDYVGKVDFNTSLKEKVKIFLKLPFYITISLLYYIYTKKFDRIK